MVLIIVLNNLSQLGTVIEATKTSVNLDYQNLLNQQEDSIKIQLIKFRYKKISI